MLLLRSLRRRSGGERSGIIVVCDGVEIKLPRGEKIPDPKSQGELINMLDSQSIIATVGALLLLRSDEYTVHLVYVRTR